MTSLADQLRLLLPPVSYDGTAERLSAAIAAEASALDASVAQAANVYDTMSPDTGAGLSDWERVLGLPDLCVADDVLTTRQRVQAVVSKLQARYGQSRAFFIELARALGYEVTISTFRPARAGRAWAGDPINGGDWSFTWRVNGPAVTINHAQAGVAAAGEPLAAWGNKQLECRLGQLKPAESILLFGYAPFDQTLSLLDELPSIMSLKRAGADTYMDAAGLLQIAAADEPRFDYDPVTLQPRGLLIEEQRTNLCLQSAALNSSPWSTQSSASVTISGTAPDGMNTANVLANGGVSNGGVQQLCAPAGAVVSFSIYVKAGTSSQLSIGLYDSTAGSFVNSNFQLQGPGSLSAANGGRIVVTGLSAAQWTRIIGVTSAATVNAGRLYLYPDTHTSASGLNNLVWGAQVEAGASASSYIPTTGAQLTRAADVATIDVPVGYTKLTYQYDDGSILSEQVRSGRPHIVPVPLAPKRIKSILMAA